MGRPVRALWLIDSLTAGGAEAIVPPLVRAADPRTLELSVCALKTLGGNPYERTLVASGTPVVNLEARHLRDGRAFRRLLALLRRERFDLVHAHLTYAAIWGALAARRVGVPLVATLHTLPCGGRVWSRERLRQRLMCWLLRLAGARVVAVSEAVRRAYAEAGLLPARSLEVLPNGIDAAAFELGPVARDTARAELGLPAGARAITTVAVLRWGKGLDVLLRAAALLAKGQPELTLLIAGDGALRPALERLARDLAIADQVRWLGFRRDVPQVLAASDLFVLPSLFDAFPGALLEAMAAALPIVASAVGGVPEILGHPPCGRLVAPGDPVALAQALAALLDAPAAERTALGEAARARLRQEFALEAWRDRLLALYRSLLSTRGRPGTAEAAAEAT